MLALIHNFGRADAVDRDGLARLVRSISRFLDPDEAVAATVPGEVDVLEAGRWGRRIWPTSCDPAGHRRGDPPGRRRPWG